MTTTASAINLDTLDAAVMAFDTWLADNPEPPEPRARDLGVEAARARRTHEKWQDQAQPFHAAIKEARHEVMQALKADTVLPVGTRVKVYTDEGFSGSRSETGTVTKVTAKSYVVNTDYGSSRRVNLSDQAKRIREVFYGPTVHSVVQHRQRQRSALYNEQRKAEERQREAESHLHDLHGRRNEAYKAAGLSEDRVTVMSPVTRRAFGILRERHAEEYQAIVDDLAAMARAAMPTMPTDADVEQALATVEQAKAEAEQIKATCEAAREALRTIEV